MWSGIINSVSRLFISSIIPKPKPLGPSNPPTHQRTICDSRVVDLVGKGVLPTSQPNEVVAVSVSFFLRLVHGEKMIRLREKKERRVHSLDDYSIASMHHVSFENRRWWFVAEPSAKNYRLLIYVAIYIGGVHNFGGVNFAASAATSID